MPRTAVKFFFIISK